MLTPQVGLLHLFPEQQGKVHVWSISVIIVSSRMLASSVSAALFLFRLDAGGFTISTSSLEIESEWLLLSSESSSDWSDDRSTETELAVLLEVEWASASLFS